MCKPFYYSEKIFYKKNVFSQARIRIILGPLNDLTTI